MAKGKQQARKRANGEKWDQRHTTQSIVADEVGKPVDAWCHYQLQGHRSCQQHWNTYEASHPSACVRAWLASANCCPSRNHAKRQHYDGLEDKTHGPNGLEEIVSKAYDKKKRKGSNRDSAG
jgi:hypothetical protein